MNKIQLGLFLNHISVNYIFIPTSPPFSPKSLSSSPQPTPTLIRPLQIHEIPLPTLPHFAPVPFLHVLHFGSTELQSLDLGLDLNVWPFAANDHKRLCIKFRR